MHVHILHDTEWPWSISEF